MDASSGLSPRPGGQAGSRPRLRTLPPLPCSSPAPKTWETSPARQPPLTAPHIGAGRRDLSRPGPGSICSLTASTPPHRGAPTLTPPGRCWFCRQADRRGADPQEGGNPCGSKCPRPRLKHCRAPPLASDPQDLGARGAAGAQRDAATPARQDGTSLAQRTGARAEGAPDTEALDPEPGRRVRLPPHLPCSSRFSAHAEGGHGAGWGHRVPVRHGLVHRQDSTAPRRSETPRPGLGLSQLLREATRNPQPPTAPGPRPVPRPGQQRAPSRQPAARPPPPPCSGSG